MCIICPSLKPPLKTPYHKAQIEALILLIFIFISHLQHPFPGTAEPCLFPGLRVNNHSLLPCGHKSIIINLAQARAALARCTRGALTLTFPPRWGNKGETTSCATWLGKTNKSQYMKATTATESTFSSPEAKHWSGNDGIRGVSGRGEQSSCAEGSQHNHIHPCGVFQAGRKPCFQRSSCNWDRAAADHAVPRGVQCCPLGDAATKTTGLCVIWGAPLENGISVQKALTQHQYHTATHTVLPLACPHAPGCFGKAPSNRAAPSQKGRAVLPTSSPRARGDSTREASTAKLGFPATAQAHSWPESECQKAEQEL